MTNRLHIIENRTTSGNLQLQLILELPIHDKIAGRPFTIIKTSRTLIPTIPLDSIAWGEEMLVSLELMTKEAQNVLRGLKRRRDD